MTRGPATLVGAVLLSLCSCGGSGGNNSAALTNTGAGTGSATGPGGSTGTDGAAQVSNLAGVWRGGNGTGSIYTFSQDGNAIRWTRNDVDEIGTATVDGNTISATYTSSAGSGASSGTISFDASGRAVRIEWSNGDSYIRQ